MGRMKLMLKSAHKMKRSDLQGLATPVSLLKIGQSQDSAAPVNGTIIGDLATEHVTPVRWDHERFYHRRFGGYGYHYWRGCGWRRW
jgi:hypothetical protein